MSRHYSQNRHSQVSSFSATKKRPSWLLAVVCVAGVGLAPIYAHGQKAPQKSAIQIYHKPLTEKTLPAPGQSMTIAAELFGTKEISLPLRLVAVRDGRLLPAPLTNSYRNAADRPVYEFEMPAPMAEISYQFVLPIPATTTGAASTPGSVTSSEKFAVRRSCVPALDARTAGNANQSELEKLAVSARVLEQEIETFSAALSATEALEKELNE